MTDLFASIEQDSADQDRRLARVIAKAIYPASFADNPSAARIAAPMSPEQSRERLTQICMAAVTALRQRGMIR